MDVIIRKKKPIIPSAGQDIISWKLSSDDACFSRSAYKMLVAAEPTNSVPTKISMQVLHILQYGRTKRSSQESRHLLGDCLD